MKVGDLVQYQDPSLIVRYSPGSDRRQGRRRADRVGIVIASVAAKTDVRKALVLFGDDNLEWVPLTCLAKVNHESG